MKCGAMKCADPEWRCYDCPRRVLATPSAATEVTDEMVERAAKALYERDESHNGHPPVKAWEAVGDVWKNGWRKQAQAILVAAFDEVRS